MASAEELAQAERDIADLKLQVAAQEKLLTERQFSSEESADAKSLLQQIRSSLTLAEAFRRIILSDIERENS